MAVVMARDIDGFRWPEFQAFARRLGIDLALAHRRIVIEMQVGQVPRVEDTFLAFPPRTEPGTTHGAAD